MLQQTEQGQNRMAGERDGRGASVVSARCSGQVSSWAGRWACLGSLIALLLTMAAVERGAMAFVAPLELNAADQPASAAPSPWTEPIDGLQFRLRSARDEWPSWLPPFVWLDIRNTTEQTFSAEQLRNVLPFNRHGNRLQIAHWIAGDTAQQADGAAGLAVTDLESLYLRPGQAFEFGQPGLQSLPAGDEIAVRLDVKDLALHGGGWGSSLNVDDATLSLCRRTERGPEFLASPVRVAVLPPGIRAMAEMNDYLTTYDTDGCSVEAGFVPESRRLVDGEELRATFVVRNVGNRTMTYEFGGDYRGANRHNRFKIDVQDSLGKALPDPDKDRFDFGGLLSGVRVFRGRLASHPIDLAKYRTFPGPGQYIVTARITLENSFLSDDQPYEIPVESKFRLTILPRTQENVAAALDRWFGRCRRTSGRELDQTIDRLCAFGGEAAVPGLHDLALTGAEERRRAAVRGLGLIVEPQSLQKLLELEQQPELRIAALQSLGAFVDDEAVERVATALNDQTLDVRTAAAGSLGRMKSEAAVDALLERVRAVPISMEAGTAATDETVTEQQALLAALGETGVPAAMPVLRESLDAADDRLRRAGVAAVIQYSTAEAGLIIREYAEDDDLDFREFVIRHLAERLQQPIQARWLAPVVRSRKGQNSIGDAPRLLRLHNDDQAAPTLLSCLDFDNPAVRSYYNATLMRDQLACRSGLAIDWVNDLNRDGTPDEIAKNRDTLARLQAWVRHYAEHPWRETVEPWRLGHPGEEATWGPVVNGTRIRARVNNSVWPEGLSQVLMIDVSNPNSGSIVMDEHPAVVEVEVDGAWYAHDPDVDDRVVGDWHAYKGHRFHSYQLTPHWKRVSDGQPLILQPGSHTARIRLTVPPASDRPSLVTSLPVKFRVLAAPVGESR